LWEDADAAFIHAELQKNAVPQEEQGEKSSAAVDEDEDEDGGDERVQCEQTMALESSAWASK
jgi:hypothetical protein